ncbi:MAG TPA: alkaline phosphatase family protein [Polyangiales bacterium]
MTTESMGEGGRADSLQFERGLAAAMGVTLLGTKLWVAWPAPGRALLGWLVEAALLALTLLLAERCARWSRPAARALFYLVSYTLLLCSTAHAIFFESAAERRFSLFEVGLSGIWYFFAHVLPASGYVVYAVVLVCVHAGALLLRRRPLRALTSPWTPALLAAAASAGLFVMPRAPSPVVDAAADVWERISVPTVEPSAGAPRYDVRELDRSRSQPDVGTLSTPFKKIVVLVMETMTAATFERERSALPADSFAKSGLAHVHRYERYFPNNQDSRTGMLDMLSSRFIPYDAYTEEGRDNYMFLSERSSLPAELARFGYQTAFAVSQNELELVVGDLPWQHRIYLDDAKYDAAKQAGELCFTPYEFEQSCEDLALLPEVLSFLDTHERAFLYQEFIWGHASIYNKTSGKSNAAYYSAYVDALIEHLRQRGTLDETLIVLTSDHGFRDTALQDRLEVYRIPLWFYATRFSSARDDRLFSHLEFKNLLHSERTLGAVPLAERPFVMIYGPTSASFVAVLTRDLSFMLLKLRGDSAFVMQHAQVDATGRVLGPAKDVREPADFLRLFFDYRRGFHAL